MEDMLHALSAPILKSFLIGGALLTAGIGAAASTDSTSTLVLHAPVEQHAIYLSAWDEGDLEMKLGSQLQPMRFVIRARMSDGCRWAGIETLVPLDERTYHYDYDELMLDCEPGATPRYRKTPRQGIVTVE
jgi:hypothetical protein